MCASPYGLHAWVSQIHAHRGQSAAFVVVALCAMHMGSDFVFVIFLLVAALHRGRRKAPHLEGKGFASHVLNKCGV